MRTIIYPQKGDITYFPESGNCLNVEVLAYEEKYRDGMILDEYRPKVLELVALNPGFPAEAQPKPGQEFVVFRERGMASLLFGFLDRCRYNADEDGGSNPGIKAKDITISKYVLNKRWIMHNHDGNNKKIEEKISLAKIINTKK